MKRDFLEIDQPEGQPTFMLNGLNMGGNFVNEPGNREIYELPGDLVGSINLASNEIVHFVAGSSSSYIILQEDDNFRTLIESPELNFQVGHWIKGVWSLVRGDERVIYWVDGINEDRRLNIDHIDDYYDDAGNLNIKELELQGVADIPIVENADLISGGGRLMLGTYRFAVELLDADLNRIAISFLSTKTVQVGKNEGPHRDQGGYNLELFPATDGGVPPASASINVHINNLDTDYDYYRLLVYRRTQGQYGISEVFRLGRTMPVTASETDFLFTGISTNDERTSLDDITVRPVHYRASKDIVEVDNRLVRANTEEKIYDWTPWKHIADGIKVIPVRGHGADSRGFMPDEVYDFAIQFIMEDGSVSPAFHIPGREAISPDDDNWKTENTGGMSKMAYYENENQQYPGTSENVRYHRFPLHTDRFFAEFTDIPTNFPEPVQGWRILIGKPIQHTVIDLSFFWPVVSGHTSTESGQDVYTLGFTTTLGAGGTRIKNVWNVFSPEVFFGDANLYDADYVVIYADHNSWQTTSNIRGWTAKDEANKDFTIAYRSSGARINITSTKTHTDERRDITATAMVDPYSELSYSQFSKPLLNTGATEAAIVEFYSDYDPGGGRVGFYGFLKRDVEPYPDLYSTLYYCVYESYSIVDRATVTDGDVHSGTYTRFMDTKTAMATDDNGIIKTSAEGDDRDYYAIPISGIQYISRVNVSKRHDSLDKTYYRFSRGYTETERVLEVSRRFSGSGGERVYAYNAKQESNFYSPDFTYFMDGDVAMPLPFNYNFARDNHGRYANRIVWSAARASTLAYADPWRTNMANDMTRVGESSGEIIALNYFRDTLLMRTEQSLWYTKPSNRELSTGAESVFVGSGAFLGAPFYEYADSINGFGGQQFRTASIETEHGVLWVDTDAGRVFLWGPSGLAELSDSNTHGMNQYLRAELPGAFDVHMGYDPIEERVIIWNYARGSKKDTMAISFSHKYNEWSSFHSYIPAVSASASMMINNKPQPPFCDSLHLYTVYAKKVYKHDSEERCKFYGYQHEFAIEFIQKDYTTHSLEQISYYAITYDGHRQVPYPTFDRMVVYSRDQSTGILELSPPDEWSKSWSNGSRQVVFAESNYRVNSLYNCVDSSYTFNENKYKIRLYLANSGYGMTQGFEDKFFMSTSNTMSQWEIIPLKNKYHYVRLYFRQPNRLSFDLLASAKKQSDL